MSQTLATPTLSKAQRADFEERVDRAIAELYGERPEERRALILDLLRTCAWDNEPAAPADEVGLLPIIDPRQRLDRRVQHFIRGVAAVDPPLARTLQPEAVANALEAFSGNKGGRGRGALHSRESALRDLLAGTRIGATDMKRIKRDRRRPP